MTKEEKEYSYWMKSIYNSPSLYFFLDKILNLGLTDIGRRMLMKCVEKEGKLLEIGVGGGSFIKLLSNTKVEVYGLDSCLAMSRRAKLYSTKMCQAKAEELPFKGKVFDVVVFSYTLSVIKGREDSIKEAKRVGKKVVVLDFLPLPSIVEWIGKLVFQAERIKLSNFKLKIQKLWFGIWSTM